MARRRLEVGAATRGDLDRLVRDALQDEQQLHDARRRASLARSALAVAVGVPGKVLAGPPPGWGEVDEPPAGEAPPLPRAPPEGVLARAPPHRAGGAFGLGPQGLRPG